MTVSGVPELLNHTLLSKAQDLTSTRLEDPKAKAGSIASSIGLELDAYPLSPLFIIDHTFLVLDGTFTEESASITKRERGDFIHGK